MNVFDEKYPQKQLTKNSQMLLRVHRKFTNAFKSSQKIHTLAVCLRL